MIDTQIKKRRNNKNEKLEARQSVAWPKKIYSKIFASY